MTATPNKELPRLDVVVLEKRKRSGRRVQCVIGEHIQFDENRLLSYCFAEWKPVVYDMLVVAAAIEFCDRLQRRPVIGWSRDIHLEIPVHDKELWESQPVKAALLAALALAAERRSTAELIALGRSLRAGLSPG